MSMFEPIFLVALELISHMMILLGGIVIVVAIVYLADLLCSTVYQLFRKAFKEDEI